MEITHLKLKGKEHFTDEERYEELTEHGCHPVKSEIGKNYVKQDQVYVLSYGDILLVDRRGYVFLQSGLDMFSEWVDDV